MSIAENVQRRLVRALDDDEILSLGKVSAQNVGSGDSIGATLADGSTLWSDVDQGDDLAVFYHAATESYIIRKADE